MSAVKAKGPTTWPPVPCLGGLSYKSDEGARLTFLGLKMQFWYLLGCSVAKQKVLRCSCRSISKVEIYDSAFSNLQKKKASNRSDQIASANSEHARLCFVLAPFRSNDKLTWTHAHKTRSRCRLGVSFNKKSEEHHRQFYMGAPPHPPPPPPSSTLV